MALELFDKLVILWGIQNFKIIPLGMGFFHVSLHTMDNQSKVISIGALNLKPLCLDGFHILIQILKSKPPPRCGQESTIF